IALAEDLLHGCPPDRRGWEWHLVKRLANLEQLAFEAARPSVNALAFSPEGSWLAVGAGEPAPGARHTEARPAEVELRDAATGALRRRLPGLKGVLTCVAISPDGSRVAVGTGIYAPREKARVTVWEAASGRLLWSA